MNRSFAFVAVVLGLAGNEAAKGSGGNASSNSAPAPHHGSSSAPAAATTTTTVTPRFSGGVPHYSGAMPYRATVTYPNGNRTLNYPPVRVSTLHPPLPSGAHNLHHPHTLQPPPNLHQPPHPHPPS